MSWMFTLLLVVQVLSSLTIISLVLLQQGKGADMGSAFGSGSAGSLFGATGAANFMSRATKWAAVVFFISTIGLAYVTNRGTKGQDTGIMQNFSQTAPVAPPAGSAVPGLPGTVAPKLRHCIGPLMLSGIDESCLRGFSSSIFSTRK